MRSNATPTVEQSPLNALFTNWAYSNKEHAIGTFSVLFKDAPAPRVKADAQGLPNSVSVNTAELNGDQINVLTTQSMFTMPQIDLKIKRSGKGLLVVYEWDNTPFLKA